MSGQRQYHAWWRWLAVPWIVAASWCLVVGLGAGVYLLLFDLICPSAARLDSNCYSEGVLLAEKSLFLLVAGLSGLVVIWSGHMCAPRARFLTGQWLALLGFILSSLFLLALGWELWPIYAAFLLGLVAALLWLRDRG